VIHKDKNWIWPKHSSNILLRCESPHENTFLHVPKRNHKCVKLKSYKERRSACWHKVTFTFTLDDFLILSPLSAKALSEILTLKYDFWWLGFEPEDSWRCYLKSTLFVREVSTQETRIKVQLGPSLDIVVWYFDKDLNTFLLRCLALKGFSWNFQICGWSNTKF